MAAQDPSTMTPDELRTYAKRLAQMADDKAISQSLEGKIAIVLHDTLCGWNHTDGCSWGYEEGGVGRWRSDAHREWRAKARKLLTDGGYDKRLLSEDAP